MKSLIAVALIIGTAFSASAADVPEYDIKAYCKTVAATAGGSYAIEGACREMEAKSKQGVANLSATDPRILSHCNDVGAVVGGSYQILEACIQQELQAKAKLNN